MAGFLLALLALIAIVAAWAEVIRQIVRVLRRPRRRPASGGAVRPSRSEPKRRDDFTLTS